LRHFVLPGQLGWHQYGQQFSWSDGTFEKQCTTKITLVDETLPPSVNSFEPGLASHQDSNTIFADPTLLHQLVVEFAQHWVREEPDMYTHVTPHSWPQIFVKSKCSLNHHRKREFTNAKIDLVKNQNSFDWPHSFIIDSDYISHKK